MIGKYEIDNRNEKLAHNLIYNSISLNENENILVEVIGEDGLELAYVYNEFQKNN